MILHSLLFLLCVGIVYLLLWHPRVAPAYPLSNVMHASTLQQFYNARTRTLYEEIASRFRDGPIPSYAQYTEMLAAYGNTSPNLPLLTNYNAFKRHRATLQASDVQSIA